MFINQDTSLLSAALAYLLSLTLAGCAAGPGDDTLPDGAERSADDVGEERDGEVVADAPGNSGDRDGVGQINVPDEPAGSGGADPGPVGDVPRYLLHITSEYKLLHLSIDDGSASEACDLDFQDEAPATGFCSLTFNREDRLFASTWDGESRLWEIELPSCRTSLIGLTGHGGVCGITPAPSGNGLSGVGLNADVLLQIDENTGNAEVVGDLGQNFGPSGATWVEKDGTIRAIEGTANGLFTVDSATGSAFLDFGLDQSFGNVGMEYHPQTEKIYACTNTTADLFEISLTDGTSSIVGDTGLRGCNNLGAPFAEPVLPPLVPIVR